MWNARWLGKGVPEWSLKGKEQTPYLDRESLSVSQHVSQKHPSGTSGHQHHPARSRTPPWNVGPNSPESHRDPHLSSFPPLHHHPTEPEGQRRVCWSHSPIPPGTNNNLITRGFELIHTQLSTCVNWSFLEKYIRMLCRWSRDIVCTVQVGVKSPELQLEL